MSSRIQRTAYRSTLWAAAALCFLAAGHTRDAIAAPVATDGVLDLRDYDFAEDGPVQLQGEWHFWWNTLAQHYEPLDNPTHTLNVPGVWTSLTMQPDAEEKLPAFGVGTVKLKILLPTGSLPALGIFTRGSFTAYEIDVSETESGLLVGSVGAGKIGRDGVHIPQLADHLFELNPAANALTITWRISNYDHFLAGPRTAPVLGYYRGLQQERLSTYLKSFGLVGVLLIIGLYHFSLFLQRREDLGSFWFANFCVAMGIRELLLSRALAQFSEEPLQQSYNWLYTLQDFTMYLSVATFISYTLSLLYSRAFAILSRLVWIASLGYAFFAFVTPPSVYTVYYAGYLGVIVIAALGALGHMVHQTVLRKPLAGRVLFGLLPLVLTVLWDNLVTLQIVAPPLIASYGVAAFVLIQSTILATRFSEAFRRSEELGENLQREVALQTVELKEQAEEAIKLRTLAQVSEREKTEFFQNISHELRTPLTLLLNPLELVAHTAPDNENIQTALRNARRLLRLVNQLLDFQKLQARKLELHCEPIDLTRFMFVCTDYVLSFASSRSIEFRLLADNTVLSSETLSESEEVFVNADLDALEKIVFNYLSNALKYTPQSGRIDLGIERRTNNRVRLFVRDSGPGIPQEAQAQLFTTFSQLENSTTRAFEGTGLGLALVKRLAERMAGTVGVESQVGEGSTFFAEFPIEEKPTVSPTAQSESFIPKAWLLADGEGQTGIETSPEALLQESSNGEVILIVDDLTDMRRFVGQALSARGYRVLQAANGEQGLEVARNHRPDLIVSDWMMPKLSGPDMIQILRQESATAHTPMILLTAKTDQDSKILGGRAGADVYLGKPFNEEELCSSVKNLLTLKAREKEVATLNHYITESVLKRYLPPKLVQDILDNKVSMDTPARAMDLTILFSDLSGFTALSESLGPELISAVLNDYLGQMNEVIFEHGGTVDKFIGDAIMVLFGAPVEEDLLQQVHRASRCAIAMQDRMAAFNQAWRSEGIPELKMRIGLHQGTAIVGNFGSAQRSDYTAIGPAVNLASRVETAAEPGEIYCTEVVAQRLEGISARALGAHELKGVTGEQNLYSLERPITGGS